MKKLFKEVWKSFSKSKVMLAGLIILIFLTSGIITLIFDVVNSYKTQYDTYKQKSVLHDVTMNTNLKLYGDAPQTFYKKQENSSSKIKYKNIDNLAPNQWIYQENPSNHIDFIQINTDMEYIKLNSVVPSLADSVYVRTQDLSNLINMNFSAGLISDTSGKNNVSLTLESSGNNNIDIFNSFGSNEDQVLTHIPCIYDTYDSNTKTWTASMDAKKVYYETGIFTKTPRFDVILIDKLTTKAYWKRQLEANKNSSEYQRYNSDKNSFYEISENDVRTMFGFDSNNNQTLDKWILEGETPSSTGWQPSAKNFFNQSSVPNIKENFELLSPITIEAQTSMSLTSIEIPSNWFVFSQYNYIFTKHILNLDGIENKNVNSQVWSGYYYDYLENLKKTNIEEFNNFSQVSYWTKDVYIRNVDANGNEVKNSNFNEEGNVIEQSTSIEFDNLVLTVEDLNRDLVNANGSIKSIASIEGINANEENASLLSTDNTASNEEKIRSEAESYKYRSLYQQFQSIADKIGIRETLTANSNENGVTNVYQFINLGNENNEIDWNGIKIKQEVGKLSETTLSNPIFSLPSNIDAKANKVPLSYVPQIVEQLLTGLSPNRNYINPMISFNSFSYVDALGNQLSAESSKIIWMTINGQKDTSNVYGITAIRNKQTGSKQYFILKTDITTANSVWTVADTFNTYDSLNNYITSNNLNFAPFDVYGNDLKIVSDNGWARQDTTYSDKYSIPFQYFLPNSDLIEDFNNAQQNPDSGLHGMEMFRDSLIKYLTLSIRPLIPASLWAILMDGVNTAFSDYGFGDGLTPPAALTTASIVRICLGVFRDSIRNSNEAFMNPLLSNIFDGIKRAINPDGNTSIEDQKIALKNEIKGIQHILSLTIGLQMDLGSFIDMIIDPSMLLDGIKQLLGSINLDKAVIEIWNTFYGENMEKEKANKTLGMGDFMPALYGNIYSNTLLKNGLKKVLQATTIGQTPAKDIIDQVLPPEMESLKPVINLVIGNKKVYELIDMVVLEDPQTGATTLREKSFIDTFILDGKELETNTLYTNDILSLISIKALGILDLNLGSLGIVGPEDKVLLQYDPTLLNPLELDMDLLWYLNNYVFKTTTNTSRSSDSLTIFGVDPAYFLHYAVTSFTEIKDDYNQVTMNENAGKIAIVNEAFLVQNKKSIYHSSSLEKDLNDISKIDDKYKINVSGVEYVIIGTDLTVDYMYPVINSENITVNTKTQALVYVNQYGYDRIKRSNAAAPTEKYFLMTTKNGQSPKDLQTALNNLVYLTATGNNFDGRNVNDDSNTYKLAYLATESSLLNPERAMRLTIIDELISNLENVQLIIGIMLFVILALVIMFVVRRYIGSRAKVLGILKAQGYSSWQIAGSICLFPLFVSLIGATLGYVAGLTAQFGMFQLFSIFWTIPVVTIPFNWLTFLLTLIVPIVLLCGLTVATTFYFLHKNKAIAMMNGSMEVNNSTFANQVKKLNAKTSVKNKFSIALALGSIGKLIALFISALFTAGVTLFFVVQFGSFNKSISKSYANKDYKYLITYTTPTFEGGELTTYYIKPGGANNVDVMNTLYVPVGDSAEGYVYFADYFKPGYSDIINKDNLNGNIDPSDTTTPHIFTKSSVDITVEAGGLSINVWKNLYNAVPESQRASIIKSSDKAARWLEWTQEGKHFEYKGKTYITRFVNFNESNEYLSLWDSEQNDFVKVVNPTSNDLENIKISYFNYEPNEEKPENAKFQNRIAKDDNQYFDSYLLIDGKEDTMASRALYRNFLVQGYDLMFNYDKNDKSHGSLLSEELRSTMPEYHLDFFISPGAVIMSYDEQNNSNDETFTYIDAINKDNQNMQPRIMGYNPNSNYIKVVDSSGNNLIEKAEQFNEDGIYPLIVNKVVREKYGIKEGNIITFEVENLYTRYQDKFKSHLNTFNPGLFNIDNNEFKFKVIGISDTYINEEWITSQNVANKVLGLNENSYNGTISNAKSPAPIADSLPLYSYNGYWSADNKIFTTNNVNELSDSEVQKLINSYREIFYDVKDNEANPINKSIMANWLRTLLPNYSNDQINNLIKQFTSLDDLNLTYSSGGANFDTASKANNAIKKFAEIYTDNALYGLLDNAVANGVEKEYIINASSTINDGMTIVLVIAFSISLTILVMITSMIINENERNIAIFGILGYTNKEKIRMFFSIYVPIVFVSILVSVLIVWAVIPAFLSTILATSSILLPVSLSFVDVLIAAGILTFIFAVTCMIAWFVQGRIKPIMLLKGV